MVISKDKFNSFLEKASETISKGRESIENELEERGITEQVQKASQSVQDSGFGKAMSNASSSASETLDELSGKKILKLVEDRLNLQEKYNDVLATKLDEALKKIDALELRLGEI